MDKKVMDNTIVRPSHYQGTDMECFDAMAVAFGMDSVITFCIMNAFKYVWRHKGKGGKDDLFKAQFYLGKASYIMERDEEYINYTQREQIRNLLDIIDKAKRDYEDGDV